MGTRGVRSLSGRDSGKGASPNRFVRRLHPAESACERRDDRPCLLDVFVRTGVLRLPEGLLLGEEAHRAFLRESGLSEDLRLLPGEEPRAGATRLRASYRSSSVRGELNRQVCRALVELGAWLYSRRTG